MRIGILLTIVADYGKTGFYNNQETGLAKELANLADEVIIYKAVPPGEKQEECPVPGHPNAVIRRIPTRARGIHGIWNCSVMDPSLDALIYFSDNQLAVPAVYKWCVRHRVKLFPYIGVTESHSSSLIRRILMDILFIRNVWVYRKCTCLVKTPEESNVLARKGVKHTIVTPVGLDLSLLHQDYKQADPASLKQKWDFSPKDKILLFIGRMTEEKQPMLMMQIFRDLYAADSSYRLLMVGRGELLEKAKQKAGGLPVSFEEQVPNSKIWELFRIADTFVNLNSQEIFGMAILEAMYYECRVIAKKAPGPNYILSDGPCGYLCESREEILKAVTDHSIDPAAGHRRVLESFTWKVTAEKIYRIIS